MKKIINHPHFVFVFLVLFAAGLAAVTAWGAGKKEPNDFPYKAVGTVTKYEVGTCMEGNINYILHPVGDKKPDLLSATSEADKAVLKKATGDKGWVQVRGMLIQGTECTWVRVESAKPVKKH